MSAQFGFPEWLSLSFFSFFLVLAWLRPLERWRRLNATALGVGAIAMLSFLFMAREGEFADFRRILPVILIPMAYWQTGQFTAPVNRKLQQTLASIDRKILRAFEGISLPVWLRRGLHVYLECSYLLVYPMVPSGLVVLFLAGAIERANDFWSVVLPPAYLCYATLPFVRTVPPRIIQEHRERNQQTGIRAFNLSVVRLVTHQANTFPSGHAATAVAVALELIRLTPSVGLAYLVIAIGIMMGAFVGRYHYAADVMLGAGLACISFLLASFFMGS